MDFFADKKNWKKKKKEKDETKEYSKMGFLGWVRHTN